MSTMTGKKLAGQEGQVFAALAALVAAEQQAVLRHQWEQAAQEPERYHFVARRALQQMEVRLKHANGSGALRPGALLTQSGSRLP